MWSRVHTALSTAMASCESLDYIKFLKDVPTFYLHSQSYRQLYRRPERRFQGRSRPWTNWHRHQDSSTTNRCSASSSPAGTIPPTCSSTQTIPAPICAKPASIPWPATATPGLLPVRAINHIPSHSSFPIPSPPIVVSPTLVRWGYKPYLFLNLCPHLDRSRYWEQNYVILITSCLSKKKRIKWNWKNIEVCLRNVDKW